MVYRIVITGAPASGKTNLIERLKQNRSFEQFVFFDEMARKLLEERPDFRQHWEEFHRQIYYEQIKRENQASDRSFISDRGTVDAFAFYPKTADEVKTTVEREYTRYDAVFHLESAAVLGEQYYNQDAIRNESITKALGIEQALADTWGKHPGYFFIKADRMINNKYQSLLNALLGFIKK